MRFVDVTLAAPDDRLGEFYRDVLGLPLQDGAVALGETTLRFRANGGGPFYHFAFLVPGDRFEAALAWVRARVELLGDEVFDFDNWDAQACYFLDAAGNVVELIAHRGLDESGRSGDFAGAELLGLSELGLVGDPPSLFDGLHGGLGLELFDGELKGDRRLAFVGARGRVLILADEGRGWLPTGRPAEPHPVEATLEAPRQGRVDLDGGRYRFATTRRPRARAGA